MDSLTWVARGTQVLARQTAALTDLQLAAPSALPGWTRKHVLAHLSANADALGNLVRWARTGQRTPMYSSAAQRTEEIESGAALPASELIAWCADSARRLDLAMAALSGDQWNVEVVTAQGRTVPATDIPWLRAREVWVHTADLDTGVGFTDFPTDFLAALIADIRARRGLTELPDGPLPEVAAYLAGRSHSLTGVADIGPWL